MPFPVTMEVLKRGQERFNIYCTPCHSRVGNGLGEIVQRGYKPAANLHDQVRMSQPISHYFYVMTHGYGAMPDYSSQLPPADRWAVAAYIRALQLSQAATAKDVPAGVTVRSLKELAAEAGHPEIRAAVAHARDGGAGISADCQRGNAGRWLRPIRRIRRFRFRKQTGRRSQARDEDVRKEEEWLTNHAASHAKTLPADLGAPAFVDGWRTRALMWGDLFGDRRDSGVSGPGAGRLGWDHVLRAWTLGTDGDMGTLHRRTAC